MKEGVYMRKSISFALFVFLGLFCFGLIAMTMGCASHYKYAGISYGSAEEALSAQKIHFDKIKSEITPTEKKRGGTAAVVIPNFDTFVALGIRKTGNPRQEFTDYIGHSLVASYRNMYNCLDQRKVFDKVTLIEDGYPIPAAKKAISEYDSVIYLNMAGPDQVQWFMRAAPDYKSLPVNIDNSKPAGSPRVLSWIDDIDKNLDQAGYKPRR
jgi:hypothetical protein